VTAPTPKLLEISVHLPNGNVKRFKPEEVAAYGVTAQGVVLAIKEGNTFKRYVGFPTVFHEEISPIEIVPASGLVGV
jgi:hypothetical protein